MHTTSSGPEYPFGVELAVPIAPAVLAAQFQNPNSSLTTYMGTTIDDR